MTSDNKKVALYAAGSGILLLMVIMLTFTLWFDNMQRSGTLAAPTGGWLQRRRAKRPMHAWHLLRMCLRL